MANTNAPFGFLPVTSLTGCPLSATEEYTRLAAGTTIFPGDPVIAAADGNIVVQATAGAGLFRGVAASYAATGADRKVLVHDDPFTLYTVQANAAGSGITATKIGLNCNTAPASGDAVRRRSNFVLAADTAATTADLDVQIQRLTRGVVDNELGEYARVQVCFTRARVFYNSGVGV